MTMLSFRAEADEAARASRWARQLGVDRSQLLRDALHQYLVRLDSEIDAERWLASPLDAGEQALAEIADWGPAEEWSEWGDAPR